MRRCIVCGKEIISRNKCYCSQECRVRHLQSKKICIICGKEFKASPSSGKQTCSIECERESRSIRGKTDENVIAGLEKAHEAAKESQNSGKFETNVFAKSWVISDPEGNRYEINNLALWAREHEEMLPGSAKQFCQGIRDIKRTLKGKKKRGNYQYKGWTIVECLEENLARKDFPASPPKKKRTKMTEEQRLERKRAHAKEYYQKKKEKGR